MNGSLHTAALAMLRFCSVYNVVLLPSRFWKLTRVIDDAVGCRSGQRGERRFTRSLAMRSGG
jgi:hypothetical protein